jgi:hypothetical protein
VFSFSPEKKDSFITFDCDDIGFQFLRIYAIDEVGNSDFAYILARIQVNEPCTFNSISGSIKDMKGQPIQDITLYLDGAGRSYNVGNTDQDGSFTIPYKENYIKPDLRFSPPENIKYLIRDSDILMLKDYLLGKTDLNEMQKFSADLNNDGKLTSNDLKLMRKYYLDPDAYSEVIDKLKFYIDDSSQNLKEIDSINDFKGFLKIRCAIKGFL